MNTNCAPVVRAPRAALRDSAWSEGERALPEETPVAFVVDGAAEAVETPIGRVPSAAALDVSGLSLSPQALETLLSVDLDVWAEETSLIPEHYRKFGARLRSPIVFNPSRSASLSIPTTIPRPLAAISNGACARATIWKPR